ncbi:MAG: LPS export ABC transporter ATP-binding protein [Holosporaceae bacterium]
MSDAPLTLSARNLQKHYKGRSVLNNVNIEVKRGEIVGLLGPNGAGKTTCFSVIAGLASVDGGQIFLGHLDLTQLPMYMRARFGIRYLPQDTSIFRGLTVEQNLLAILELFYKDRATQQNHLQQLLDEFDLNHIRFQSAKVLSGGERRRVEIARCLIGDPHFILFDEPLAGIDPKMIQDVRSLITHLKDRNIGILITDHNVRETLAVVDRAYILNNGIVFKEGTPKAIAADKKVRATYLGSHFQL